MARAPRKHRTVKKDGYELTFYPGFLRKARVESGDGQEVVLYQQKKPYDIRGRDDEPLERFTLRLQGGRSDRDVTLRIDDPKHAIAQIVVRFHREGHDPRSTPPAADPVAASDETVTFDDFPILCPPVCDEAESEPKRPPAK